ncbi:nuclear transport factor 2 family protein [Hydrogenophaga crassostreae]|nr:nuclear transport factor 2 family protein [Hydrogenophaga crassostreae]
MTITEQLTALETERCRCVVEQDYQRLGDMLSPALIHTHIRGNVDTKESYLRFVSGLVESLELRREGLRVVSLGDTAAVMHGKQINRARKRGQTDELLLESMVTQVWALEADGQWRLAAFHASPLSAPPPPVAH